MKAFRIAAATALMGTWVVTAEAQEGERNYVPDHWAVTCVEPSSVLEIDLIDALASAYAENPRILAAQDDLKISEAGETTATAAFYPSITASLGGQRFVPISESSPVSVDSLVVGGQEGQYTNYSSVGIDWNIYNGGRDLASYRASQARYRASRSDLANQRNDTLVEVLSAYSEMARVQGTFAGDRKQVLAYEAIALRAAERFERRNGTLIKLNQARMERAQAEREAFKTCRDLFARSGALAETIGMRLTIGHVLHVAESVPEAPGSAFDPNLTEEMILREPAVVAAQERKAEAAHRLDKARAALSPTVALVARYDWLGARRKGYEAALDATYADSYRYGFTLQQPLFPYAGYQGGKQAAEADLHKTEVAYREAVIAAENRLQTALSTREQALAIERSAGRSAEEALRTVALAKKLFAGGEADLDMVERAQLDADRARQAASEARAERVLTEWLVYRALHPNEFAPVLFATAERGANGERRGQEVISMSILDEQ